MYTFIKFYIKTHKLLLHQMYTLLKAFSIKFWMCTTQCRVRASDPFLTLLHFLIFYTDKKYKSVHSITSQCLGEPPLKYLHSPEVTWNYRPANLMQHFSQLSLSVVLPNEKWQPRIKLLLRGCPGLFSLVFGSTSVILTSYTL